MFFIFGGSVRSYKAGAALILAECSRCETSQQLPYATWDREKDLTVLALPDKIGLAPAAAHVVLLEAADRDPVGVCFTT